MVGPHLTPRSSSAGPSGLPWVANFPLCGLEDTSHLALEAARCWPERTDR